MNNKILGGIVLLILLLPTMALGLEELGTFKTGEDITLMQTCASCTYNNITSVVAPDSTELIGEVAMVKSGTKYTYSLGSGNVTQIGTYKVHGVGDLNGVDDVWVYTFNANPIENDVSDVKDWGVPAMIAIIGFVAMIISLFVIFNKREDDSHSALRIMFLLITPWLSLIMVRYAQVITEVASASSVDTLFNLLYRINMVIAIVITLYVVLYYLFKVIQFFRFKKENFEQWD